MVSREGCEYRVAKSVQPSSEKNFKFSNAFGQSIYVNKYKYKMLMLNVMFNIIHLMSAREGNS